MPLQWSFNSATVMNLPWHDELALLQEFGWRGAEVWLGKFKKAIDEGKAKSFEAMARQMNDAGVKATGTCAGVLWTKSQAQDPAAEWAEIEKLLDFTAAVGAPATTLIALGKLGDDLRPEYDTLVEKFRRAGDLAKARNLRVNIEFLGGLPILGTLMSGIEVVNAVDHPNVGLLFDLVHYYTSASHLEDLRLLKKGKLFAVHVDDSPRRPMESLKNDQRCWPGEGRMDVPAILRELQSVGGFNGWFTFELYDPSLWNNDPRVMFEGATRCREMLDKAMSR